MKSGKPSVSVAALIVLGTLWAPGAGDEHEDGTEAMYLEPEFTARAMESLECGNTLRFERIRHAGGAGPIDFEWEPQTGQLSFHARETAAGIMLPEHFVTAIYVAPVRSCE